MQEGGDRGEGRMKKTDCARERERERRGGIERERENGRVMQSVPGLGSSRLFEPRYDPALPPNPVSLQDAAAAATTAAATEP